MLFDLPTRRARRYLRELDRHLDAEIHHRRAELPIIAATQINAGHWRLYFDETFIVELRVIINTQSDRWRVPLLATLNISYLKLVNASWQPWGSADQQVFSHNLAVDAGAAHRTINTLISTLLSNADRPEIRTAAAINEAHRRLYGDIL